MHIFLLILMTNWIQPSLVIKSTAFANTNHIPPKYTCTGENISPELLIEGLPSNTKTMALIMEDPDTALGTFDHWVVWNIPPVVKIEEGSKIGVTGQNSRKENKYTGPCPPNGIHEYHFKIYALDTELNLPQSTGKKDLLKAIEGHILASAELTGSFQK